MTKIFLIRHGQSEWNKLNKIQGQKNTILTELGEKQAAHMGNRLIEENIDIIYSSDLKRAYDTAKIISNIINKPLISSEAIREINFGQWEGLNTEELQEKYKNQYRTWTKEPDKLNMDGAETLEDLKHRGMKYIENIVKENQNKNIAIVSHGVMLKVIILGLLGVEMSHYKNISLNNVSLSIVECRTYNNVLTLLNDTSHLKELI
ncbi:histidine phosphatase family protein [Tissierella sp. MB52-C2]|uniref:histidine phosphatase family protein n=1 Tax=Tissierella sp. MB52-C2 TaxID=3070999 RepID=UPI00280A763F|nr:histidine phosphatase family protein [Tissierella sp. MB52-C2]WMM26500.1 histidine phosphatase family protein [Tissierella sp. MB52-C2]